MTRWPPNTIAVPTVVSLLCAWDGLGYLLGPAMWSGSPSLDALTRWGGIRPYGLALTLTAVVLLVGLLRRSLVTVRVGLALSVACYTANAASVLVSWQLVGIAAWGAPSKGLGFAAFAFLILRRTPDRAGE